MSNFPRPTEIMKARRPYLYSDSSKAGAYSLSRSEFSHFLDTLTERNQHKDFEIFCRHLCERVLCPNLRTQTGPEGGGDGKVDTETFAVADEISQRWFVGDTNSGKERWGFAMSAKEKWTPKVRSDVKGIIETGRKYDRIYFLTSRPVKANKCHDEEQALTKKYGVPVTILDREWIIENTIGNGFEDLAYDDLQAGSYDPSKLVVGPLDHRRSQELSEIEERILRLGGEQSDQTQLVSHAFESARLSRELERPRFETEGRFRRAIDIAIKEGTHDQILRAKYEYVWTMLWWHDDVEPMNQSFEDIENTATKFDNAADISKLCNLLQVLAARVFQDWETSDHLNLEARRKRVKEKLSDLSQNKSRPNNALYAETLLILSRLTDTEAKSSENILDDTWKALEDIVDRAEGFGEFPAELIDQVVEAMSSLVPESMALDSLAEKLAEFMGQRKKEGKAGEIYLARGKRKLDNERPIEAVGWLGKASICFMKEEYREEQFETLYCLAVAYRGAGLLWASRAVCLAALVQANAISAEDAETKIETIPTVSFLALISLQLGRVSDLLLCVYWMRGFLHTLPIDEESKLHLDGKIQELDTLFSCFIAGVERAYISSFADLPDMLAALGLFHSKVILMYRLGRANELEEQGLLPKGMEYSELSDMVNAAASQPASADLPKFPRLNQKQAFYARTSIIGVLIEFNGDETIEDVLLCEGCVTAIESFLATAFSYKVWPKTEKLRICIEIDDDIEKPELAFEPKAMALSFRWPKRLSLLDAHAMSSIGEFLLEFCANTLGAIAALPEPEGTLEHMVTQENLFERTISFSFAHFAQSRVLGKYLSSLDDLSHLVVKSYPPLEPIPTIVPQNLGESEKPQENKDVESDIPDIFSPPRKHSELSVSSVINTHLWDQAGWGGVLYAHSGPMDTQPPLLGLSFESKEMASSIFKEWNEKFGRKDVEDRIRISIIRGIDADNRHHYRAHVTQSIDPERNVAEERKTVVSVSRLNTMEPDSSTNLDGFLEQFEKFGMFFLVPAVISASGREPELLLSQSILSRNLHIRQAWEIEENDPDFVAVRNSDNIVSPSG